MRTEKEMFDLILNVAKADERIRAVYMNGSRANPNIPKDIYQDYDIVYVVTETKSFLEDKNWISVFGELTMLQEPDSNNFGWGLDADFSRSYGWLMLFKDGNRIDLHIVVKEEMLKNYISDTLTVPLLDKDSCLPEIPPTSDKQYWVKKPTVEQYRGCCNDFWWCLNNVAKGIARDELPYAMWMYNVVVREMLFRMVDWYIGINSDFSLSPGKMGKFYKKYLPRELYEMVAKTYSDSDYEHFWEAVFTACDLFRTTAVPVAGYLQFTYNQDDDTNMTEYLKKIKSIHEITDSVACCGLVCKLCHLADSCDGCGSEENCCGCRTSYEGCYQYDCCREKGIDGCWECETAPCDKGMFSSEHDVRNRAFIRYIKENGRDKLAERLYSNTQKGIFYGYGKDYDGLGSIEAVIQKLEG